MRIILDNPPEFYTNLDTVVGRAVLFIHRAEQVGAIVVKLEGEAKTAARDYENGNGNLMTESHKVLYKVQQVFPPPNTQTTMSSVMLRPGTHEFPFRFKIPFNNVCSDVNTMARLGGLGGGGFLGSGVRVMDGSTQVFLRHVTKTLPPSFVGAPHRAEIRYYIKVTVQRPGILRENWRHHVDFRFMPIEEPRPDPRSEAKSFAKRPFVFRPKSSAPSTQHAKFFGGKGKQDMTEEVLPPTIEMCAWFPHPIILTCNKPVPLRLVATKKALSTQQVYLTSLQIELFGQTKLRCFANEELIPNRFVIISNTGLHIPLTQSPNDPIGAELQVPDYLWKNVPLPNTISPSFVSCNIIRTYQLNITLGLSWETQPAAKGGMFSGKGQHPSAQTIRLPLVFKDVQIYSGIAPPPEVLRAMANRAPRPQAGVPRPATNMPAHPQEERPPQLPPRTNSGRLIVPNQGGMYPQHPISPITGPNQVPVAVPDAPAPALYDPLYPPQMGTVGFEEAPPSYDEAMAVSATGPTERPAFSGETGDGGPTQMPTKGDQS
ncbi:uncharacterized protein DNG_02390 [Cephalotrichum gorgonifer]|uniref:Arrestin-like N-terminal domain-containing protein n=1 Tax=Cephalotrichum gorgonifer TaxID=2041049 RepID=A0AAE8MSY1_9PEZI|nr:uncharacterized protein DNG_02390 [Cephalotrichum gorgonifer]